jgi:hypothetical protein
MTSLATEWDARIDRLSTKLPARLRVMVEWLREPRRRISRILAALLFILGGIFSILPILGIWMLPLGLALLSQDVPWLKAPLETSARWIESAWRRVSRRRGQG